MNVSDNVLKRFRSLFLAGVVCVFFLVPGIVSAQNSLDFTAQWHFERMLDEADRPGSLFEAGLYVGLSKTFWSYVTFSGHIGLVYAGRPQGPWQYAYRNHTASTYHVWGIGFVGEMWIHVPDALVGVTGGIHGRSYFMPTRSGVFRVGAYVGIASRLPFSSVLKGAVVGVRYYFSLVDDFEKVFRVQSQAPALSIVATFQF